MNDLTAPELAAHTLKSSRRLGALRLAGLCQMLETESGAGSLEQTASRIMAIESEYQRALFVLRADIKLEP